MSQYDSLLVPTLVYDFPRLICLSHQASRSTRAEVLAAVGQSLNPAAEAVSRASLIRLEARS